MEFRVTTLPDNIKDPADYVHFHKTEKKIDDKFREEVLEKNSIGWMDWYQRRVISQYNNSATDGEKNGFANILDRLGSFLSMIKDDSEKKRRLKSIVDQLVVIIPNDINGIDVSESVRLQLESELERKSSKNFDKIKLNPTSFAKKIEQTGKLLARKIATSSSSFDRMVDTRRETRSKEGATRDRDRDRNLMQSRRFRIKKATPKTKTSLTPHFSGFDFQSKHDVGWLDETEIMVSGKRDYG